MTPTAVMEVEERAKEYPNGRGRQSHHGLSYSSTYKSWHKIIQRCRNKNRHSFGAYGGRGIDVCERWLLFENFLADMGCRPDGTSIDRIDNNKGYYKENCRWATPKEQANNRSNTIRLTLNGYSHTLAEWSDILGIKRHTLHKRLENGWSVERTLTTEKRTYDNGNY